MEITNPYGFIYITTNMVNGRKYIGQKKFDNKGAWKTYLGSGTSLKQAVKMYGRENFSREIVMIAFSEKGLNLLEIEFIKNHDASESRDYYNISFGGEAFATGTHHSEEARRSISQKLKGRVKSADTRRKLSEAFKGKPLTEDTKRKMRDARIGRHCSEETKQRISMANKGISKTPQAKINMGIAQKGAIVSLDGRRHMSFARRARLSDEQLTEIRYKYGMHQKQSELAKQYKVSMPTISFIVNYKGAYSKNSWRE